MQTIKLKGPAVINGAVRYPAEGAIPVSDGEAKKQRDAENVDDGESDDLDGKSVADLKKIAEQDGIDLGEATKKTDIIAAIRAHRATPAE
ncbi:MAG TPA: hypothetical protein VF592_03615 [Sphingomonas sp.]|jgi:hypothetical protein|uniref:hypothetical protein n=1 Tax=Sphingomonas sp. TaxID=28214 RepID=UPI002EDB0933